MGQPGEFPAGFAQGCFSQFCLNPAKAVFTPHGTAAFGDGHNGFSIFLPENFPEPVTQGAGQNAVEICRLGIHLNVPFLAAAVWAAARNAAEGIKVGWF
jgi:hypothetical protein